ncbi:MAG: hypothetical protein KGY99_04790 [Phycisphaerae bacterium]|nr:hypothetical protein [Phycisphaerae bacterium]
MTTTDDPQHGPPKDVNGLLGDIAAVLERQLELAQAGQYEQLARLDADLRRCTERLAALNSGARPDQKRIERIAALEHALELALAEQKSELAERIGKLRRSRPGLAAYAAAKKGAT